MSTQVVLVSDQVLQNLIPILMERPARVFLVLTEEMARRGADRRLSSQLRGADAQLIRCEGCPDSGFPAIQRFAHQVAETVLNAGADTELVLNATGGTKLMSLAFVEAFRGLASRILYTDTAHRRIEYLASSADAAPAPTPMGNVLDVPAYLRAQGFQFQRAVSDDPAG